MERAIEFEQVCRYYGEVVALDHVSFDVADGEFFSMLGPSGSGKTTSLRIIAGFERPSSGKLTIFGETAQGIPPYERNVNTVFQDYALFPHMTILENVSYGLRVKGVKKKEYLSRAKEMLELVKLQDLGDRRPSQLSGGQRQRIALARALVNHPRILLLDEPLGALDLKLRKQMQVELKALQRYLGITFIYVTHDQDEALSMSDRLAVFRQGNIEQTGTPKEIYDFPKSVFVADFVGDANVLDSDQAQKVIGIDGPCAIRPERISFFPDDAKTDDTYYVAQGKVVDINYHGSSTCFSVELAGDCVMQVRQPYDQTADPSQGIEQGSSRNIGWKRADMRCFPSKGA